MTVIEYFKIIVCDLLTVYSVREKKILLNLKLLGKLL